MHKQYSIFKNNLNLRYLFIVMYLIFPKIKVMIIFKHLSVISIPSKTLATSSQYVRKLAIFALITAWRGSAQSVHKWLTAIKGNSVALLPLFFGLKEVDCGEVVCVSPWGFSSDTISYNHTRNVCYTVRGKKIVVTKNKCQKSSSMLLLIKYIYF